jgi:hypothetical protein
MTILRNPQQETIYELKYLPNRYWKLGPLAWLLDHYVGRLRSQGEEWIEGGQPVFDHAVAEQLGTAEEIVEDWRWFLAPEGLIRQQKVKEGGWLISPNPDHEQLLDDWLAAWRKLRYLRETVWWWSDEHSPARSGC